MVVACHACSHLSDSLIDVCIEAKVDFAVMPCCHRDLRTANQMALVAKSLQTSKAGAIDAARLGAIVARGFDARWRTIDAAITPENRILVGLARPKGEGRKVRAEIAKQSDMKLSHVYARIHGCASDPYAELCT